jgi:hypothetical protein
MNDITVQRREVTVISYTNKDGYRVVVPMYYARGKWETFGSCQVYGVSKSDSKFASVHALPYKWRPKGALLAAINHNRRK